MILYIFFNFLSTSPVQKYANERYGKYTLIIIVRLETIVCRSNLLIYL